MKFLNNAKSRELLKEMHTSCTQIMKVFCAQSEHVKNTKFILRSINPGELDKQYIMKELQDSGTIFMTQQLNSISNPDLEGIHKLHTTLESNGVSRANAKPLDTIVLNDELSIKLFASPINKPRGHLRCWYCRNLIPPDWFPIGLPTQYSEKTQQFSTEGCFCSFNCISSYTHENANCFRYKDSGHLLYMMYRKIFHIEIPTVEILPSPSWKLLKEYGGHLDVDDYRKCLQFVDYKQMNQTWSLPTIELFTEVQ